VREDSAETGVRKATDPAAGLFLGALFLAALAAVPERAEAQRDRAEALRAQGDAHLAAGDRGSAIGYYRDAITAFPADGPSYAALGRIYLDRGALADARTAFEAGVAHAPDHSPLHLGLAEVLDRMGAPDQAALVLRDLARRTPRDATVHAARADLARRRGAFGEALSAYRAILALEGDAPADLAADARRNASALRFLVGTLDPVTRCPAASAVRRALAGCRD
jgi:tetratricopeptide (TPR) repeat protein